MDHWIQTVITIVGSIAASTGFWAYIQRKIDCNSNTHEMLIGLGHDRIMCLGMTYIERGYITNDEYENLNNYLYEPYRKMGGNGSAERIMNEVKQLPIRRAEQRSKLKGELEYETR